MQKLGEEARSRAEASPSLLLLPITDACSHYRLPVSLATAVGTAVRIAGWR